MFVSLSPISESNSRSLRFVPAAVPNGGDLVRIVDAIDSAGDERPVRDGVTDVARKRELAGRREGGGGIARALDDGRDNLGFCDMEKMYVAVIEGSWAGFCVDWGLVKR
jgi:hypothetical protein